MKLRLIFLLVFAFINVDVGAEGVCSAFNLTPFENWLCNLDKWILSWEEWINLVKDDCYPGYFIRKWFETDQNSHRVSSVPEDCVSPRYFACENVTDNITYCYCRDGSYRDRLSLIKVWKRNRNFLNTKIQIFSNQFRNCMKWEKKTKQKQTGLKNDNKGESCPSNLPFDAWMCEFPEWIISSKKWKQLMTINCKGGKLQVSKNLECPVGLGRQRCLNKQYLICESNTNSCEFCYCANGMYNRPYHSFLIWQKGQTSFQKRLKLFQKSLKQCKSTKLSATENNIAKIRPDISESSLQKNDSNIRKIHQDLGRNFKQNMTWPVPVFKDCSSACSDVINGLIHNNPVGFALKGTKAKIYPSFAKEKGVNVYCDCTNGSDQAWTVFQRRMDGSVNFSTNWTNYTEGFGDSGGEFWLGLELLHLFTKQGNKELRIDLGDKKRRKSYAGYRHFTVGDSETQYKLSIGDYQGNALDALGDLNGTQFHTPDFGFAEYTYIGRPLYYFDEDIGDYAPYLWPYRELCSVRAGGGWWFIDYNADHDYYGSPNNYACASSILNGKYEDLLYWTASSTLSAAEMKFRIRS